MGKEGSNGMKDSRNSVEDTEKSRTVALSENWLVKKKKLTWKMTKKKEGERG